LKQLPKLLKKNPKKASPVVAAVAADVAENV
jgi:hypothetical protein